MSEVVAAPWLGRSVLAIVTGFLVTALLSVGLDMILHALRIYPPWGRQMSDNLFVVALGYRIAFTMFGGYVTAALSPYKPTAHALVLGCVGTVAATAGAIATWNAGLGPHWYPVALVVTALPSVWAGAQICTQVANGAAPRI